MKICSICLTEDGVKTSRAVTAVLPHPIYQTPSPMFVCASCLERGRTTRVNCKTFIQHNAETVDLGKRSISDNVCFDPQGEVGAG
jgi:hypothetical protein